MEMLGVHSRETWGASLDLFAQGKQLPSPDLRWEAGPHITPEMPTSNALAPVRLGKAGRAEGTWEDALERKVSDAITYWLSPEQSCQHGLMRTRNHVAASTIDPSR